jgi:cobalt-zinc-cadmium efflux system outer membrane protein
LKPYLRFWMASVFACLLGGGQSLHGQTPAASAPLTLQQVIDYTFAHNPALLASRQNLLSMNGQVVEAGLRQNPNFAVYGSNLSNPANTATPYAYSLQLSRLFERGEKRKWRLDSAQATMAQTAAQLHDQERGTILAAKQAFTNMLLAKEALKVVQDMLKNYLQQMDIFQARYKDGDLGKLDYERLDLQLAQYESEEQAAEAGLVQGSDQLQTLMGYEQPRRDFDIAGDLVPPAIHAQLTDLEQRALANRPDYQAAKAAVLVADANVKLAFANGTTDPTLEGEYDHSGNLSSYGFSASIPIRIFDHNQGNKDTSKYLAQGSRFSETAARNQIFSDVDQAWIAYTTSKVLSDRYNDHYLAEAKDVLTIAEYAYKRGGFALIDYLNALQDDRTTTLNALDAEAQAWMAIHQLSYTTASEVVP